MDQQEIKLPSVGRIVHYFPVNDKHCQADTATVLPATVVQVFGSRINLSVTTMNPDGIQVLRYSVPHESTVTRDIDGKAAEPGYWAWPEIK